MVAQNWWRKSILRVWLKGLATFAAIIVGGAVTFLVVSIIGLGPAGPEIIVPDVVRVPQNTAEQILKEAGLTCRVVAHNYHPSVPAGRIIKLRPLGGSRVRAGREVQLTVSKGPRAISVPDVVGKALDEASAELEDNHLTVGDITRRRSDRPVDEVIGQRPLGGQKVDRDESVALEVSGGADYAMVVDATGHKTLFRRVSVVVPAGESFQEVRIILRDKVSKETVYDRIHEPGDKVAVALQATSGGQVQVYLDDKLVFEKRL